MPAVKVSTADKKNAKIHVTITGIAMDETSARKTANNLRSWARYELGLSCDGDDGDQLEVTLEADATPLPTADEAATEVDPESEALSATAIAAMSTAEYRAAKAAGRIPL